MNLKQFSFLLFFVAINIYSLLACTNLLVTRGASADGSTMLVYTNDGYIKDGEGRIKEMGYPEHWKGTIIRYEGDKHRIPNRGNAYKPY